MHKSKLVAAILDCETDDLTAAARFWSAALGRKPSSSDDFASAKYVSLGSGNEELLLMVQKVPHPSRVHIDIETDNVDAEVARLEALGAKRIEQVKTWWVMEAPTGHRFCVVKPQRDGVMPRDANEWS